MTQTERFIRQLVEIVRDDNEKLRPAEHVRRRLQFEDWVRFRPMAVEFAKEEIRRRKWRGRRGGVLPQGHDAESVADEVIVAMLARKTRLRVGFTPERIIGELKRLVGQRVRVLHRLKEVESVRNESDGVEEELKNVRAHGQSIQETVCRAEEEAFREQVIGGFQDFLNAEPELRAIFGCLCAGLNGTEEIAHKLGMDKPSVVKGRKRLARRVGAFRGVRSAKTKSGKVRMTDSWIDGWSAKDPSESSRDAERTQAAAVRLH